MSTPSFGYSNYFVELARGAVPNQSSVHKFGRNSAVGTTMVPISMGGVYQMPVVGSATTLRVKAGNAADASDGDGAREITVQGLDETGALISEALATNGASAGTAGEKTFLRVFRAWVSASGSYATAAAGSHTADIVIENAAGSADWMTIDSTDFPRGQSECAAYTIPLGFKGWVTAVNISVSSTRPADVVLFKREGALDTAAPYSAMRMQHQFTGLSGATNLNPDTLFGPFPALTDILFMSQVGTATGEVEVDFEIMLEDLS